MTTVAICRHQGLFYTAVLSQVHAAGEPYAFKVELIAHDEVRDADNQRHYTHTLGEASGLFNTAVQKVLFADMSIAEYIPGERERIEREWEDAWQEEDRTTGQRVRDALKAQLDQQ